MLLLGIDAGDKGLACHLRTPDNQVLLEREFPTTQEGLSDLLAAVEKHARPDQIAVAMESANAAWVQLFLDRGYQVYPVNPKAVENYRQSLYLSGAKCDRVDAMVLAMYLGNFMHKLRVLRPDAPEIVSFRLACIDRTRLMYERTAKGNELLSTLKMYYPAFVPLFVDHTGQAALEFLCKFPTQSQMLALTPKRLANWLKNHGYSCTGRFEAMASCLSRPCLPVAAHLQLAKAPLIQYLAQSLLKLKALIDQTDQDINRQFDDLPESRWARSLPGAGKVLGPALLAVFGRDPQRFAEASEAQTYMGTAPVTKSSGQSRCVRFRRGCWKFARRTLQLLADVSRRGCLWAQEFYLRQRESGHSHHQAIRALANKWVKIIVALRRTGQAYDESIFLQSQQRYLSKTTPAAC